MRRGHKETPIKLFKQSTDETPGIASNQLHTKDMPHVLKMKWLLSEAVFVTLVVAIPLSAHAGFFSNLFGVPTPVMAQEIVPDNGSAIETPLLSALQNPNPSAARGGAEILVEDDALVSSGPIGEEVIAEQKAFTGEIRVYTVREGDSLSQVADMFGVNTNTIMWANDLNRANEIQPGDDLVILPVAGVRHVVTDGDTVSTIAKKYDGDEGEIIEYNQILTPDELLEGETIIIPGGAVQVPVRSGSGAQPVKVSGSTGVASVGFSHPAPGSIKTQGIHGYNAVDLAGGAGSPIRAAAGGEVVVAKASGWNGGYGNYIVIRHPNGTQTLYAHLSSVSVGMGNYVSQGEVIGGMGNTGRSTGTHLHFEVRGGLNPF